LIDRSAEVEDNFISFRGNEDQITDVFSIFFRGKRYPISYELLVQAHGEVIAPVLQEKLGEIIKYCAENKFDISAMTEDNFKIALVGGFNKFYLNQKKIEDIFAKGADDKRFQDMIMKPEEYERAISYGATLIANEKISFRQTARYSIGLSADGKTAFFAIKKGMDIKPGEEHFLNKVWIGGAKARPLFVYCHYDDLEKANFGRPLPEFWDKLTFNENRFYKLALSFDNLQRLTFHKHVYGSAEDAEQQENEIKGESSSELLDKIHNLVGEGMLAIGGEE